MCMACVGAAGTAFQAATLIGGPFLMKHMQRIRRALGLRDNSVAAVEARAADEAARLDAVAPPADVEARPAPGAPEPEAEPQARAGRRRPRTTAHAMPATIARTSA